MYLIWQRHKSKFLILLLVVVPVLMILGWGSPEIGNKTNTLSAWTRSTQGLGAYVARTLGGGAIRTATGWWDSGLETENDELRTEIARLRDERSRLIGVLQENDRLRRMVAMTARRPEFELVPAEVISRDSSPYFRVIKIRVQTEESVLKPRMPVIVAEGVVGQVHEVSGKFADIIITSDPRHRVDAISQRTRAQAVVTGLGNERDYHAKLSYLSELDSVRSGDVIVTSGMGGIFPKELIIGTVKEVNHQERDLFQDVSIEPSVDFSRLEEVFVITGIKK